MANQEMQRALVFAGYEFDDQIDPFDPMENYGLDSIIVIGGNVSFPLAVMTGVVG